MARTTRLVIGTRLPQAAMDMVQTSNETAAQASTAASDASVAAGQAAATATAANTSATQAAAAANAAATAANTALTQLAAMPRLAVVTIPSPALLVGTRDVVVSFPTPMPDDTYAAFVSVLGGTGVLGSVTVRGVIAKTAAAVTVRLEVGGLVTLAASALTIQVLAIR
jgi:hypothetical protein